jgi:hypothetical protein
MDWLPRFVSESNKIEGILRAPTNAEIAAHETFLSSNAKIADLEAFVAVAAPGHRLRDRLGLNVRVGNHVPPVGGPHIREGLGVLLSQTSEATPFKLHCAYEDLHPFTDGNGRSGRALWLWMMLRRPGRDAHMARKLGFLHTFYYQTLSASDDRIGKTEASS